MRLEHSRKNNAMENDIVLAYKVYKFCIFLAPIVAPHIGQLLSGAYIANRRVKPYIQHLAFRVWQWHRYAPTAVAGHGARLQPAIQPAFTLPVHIGLPLVFLTLY